MPDPFEVSLMILQGLLWIWGGLMLLVGTTFRFVLSLVAVAIFLLWWCQHTLLYVPNFGKNRQIAYNGRHMRSPAEYAIPFEDHYLRTRDKLSIHAWLLKHEENMSTRPTLLYFHGNAGNIGFRLQNAAVLHHMGFNLLLLEYRGYGNSEGEPSEYGLKLDAQAALLFLRSRPDIDKDKIFIFGRSLGGAVGFSLASTHSDEIAGLIVENTFMTIPDVVRDIGLSMGFKWAKWIKWPIWVFCSDRWQSVHAAKSVTAPVMIISGLEDKLIPPHHSEGLRDALVNSSLVEFQTYEHGTHNDTYVQGGEQYYVNLMAFVARVVS